MLNAKRSSFLEKMAFGEPQAGNASRPRAIDLLMDAAWMLGVTAYMVAVLLFVAWACGALK